LGVCENNIGNGAKHTHTHTHTHTHKGVKIKTQKQSYEVLDYKERLM
jgi:hypothetical protein